MLLPLKNFSSLVADMSAAVQSVGQPLMDMSVGSVLRAVLEANASLALWIQWLLMIVLSTTRASTSNGSDLDSWMADFSLIRLPGAVATGTITLGRITPGLQAVVPTGAVVKTADGSVSVAVQQDTTRLEWSAVANGYIVDASADSINLPVAAVIPGNVGNVQAGSLVQLSTAIPGIDSVSNPLALQYGLDAESDSALRVRFASYINSRSQATLLAVGFAVSSVQQGLRYVIAENQDGSGRTQPGNFVVTVDDGSGSSPATLLSAVQSVVDQTRPIGSTYAVLPPVIIPASIILTLKVQPESQAVIVSAEVNAQITAWIQALAIGASLPISRIASLAYAADPTVTNVTLVSINTGPYDLVPPANGLIQLSSLVIN